MIYPIICIEDGAKLVGTADHVPVHSTMAI